MKRKLYFSVFILVIFSLFCLSSCKRSEDFSRGNSPAYNQSSGPYIPYRDQTSQAVNAENSPYGKMSAAGQAGMYGQAGGAGQASFAGYAGGQPGGKTGIPSSSSGFGAPPPGYHGHFGPPPTVPRIDLSKRLYWCQINDGEDVNQVLSSPDRFEKLTDTKNMNLYRLLGKTESYVLVKADFVVPESYRGRALGCLVSYIHFADMAYVNGALVGRTGVFAPANIGSFYVSHQYPVPESLINYGGKNTICFKIYCRGKSSFSGKMFVGEMKDVTEAQHVIDFWNSLVYIFFAGILFAASIIFIIFFIARREKKEFLSFAQMNFFSAILVSFLYSGSLPVHEFLGLPYDIFLRLFLCIGALIIVYFYVTFHFNYLGIRERLSSKVLRAISLVIKIALVMVSPSYTVLMKICPVLLFICALELLYAFSIVLLSFRSKVRIKNARFLLYGIIPLFMSLLLDFILRYEIRLVSTPFVTMFGWVIEIMLFVIVLAVRFERLTKENEHLTNQLQKEVEIQTKNLTIANENLAKEIYRANQDLEMASIVQRKYFPSPNRKFKGWDVSISYNPLSNVSGDLYDYYYNEEILKGFSLFDVSGHGLSASLITMLAKNIIAFSFDRGLKRKHSVSDMLLSINDRIIREKGNIDNYLTGLLFKISEPDENDDCSIQFANAGHPHPVFYSKKRNSVEELKYSGNQKHYGAIGLLGIDVSFPESSFTAENGDIILLYTDGLTESMNENMEAFGIERVKTVLAKYSDLSASKILENLLFELEKFTDGVPKTDDVSVVILKKEDSSLYHENEENLDTLEYLDAEELEPVDEKDN